MKNHHVVFSVMMLLILFYGCSVLKKEQKHNITGTWTGKSTVAYKGNSHNYNVSLTFNKDKTLTLSYDMGDKKLILHGNYTTNFSKSPALIDFVNFGFPKGESYCCMAIAEFPMINKMNISGIIGQCGEINRPTEFIRNPTARHQLYLELTKKE